MGVDKGLKKWCITEALDGFSTDTNDDLDDMVHLPK